MRPAARRDAAGASRAQGDRRRRQRLRASETGRRLDPLRAVARPVSTRSLNKVCSLQPVCTSVAHLLLQRQRERKRPWRSLSYEG